MIPQYKVLLIGESAVGKTALINRIVYDKFYETTTTTALDFSLKQFTINDQTISLQIWDTVGQERYRSLIRSIYNNTRFGLVTFDVTNRITFDQVQYWVQQLINSDIEHIALVGNCIDKPVHCVRDNEVYQFIEKIQNEKNKKLLYFKVSAKENINVEQMFQRIAHLLISSPENKVSLRFDNMIVVEQEQSINKQKRSICKSCGQQ